MYLFRLQPGTRCRRCNCIILPHERYRGLNMDGCIIFIHTDSL